jgi:fumarate reductase flavoprotein subunit
LVLDEQIRRERVVAAGLAGITDGGPKDPLEYATALGARVLVSETLEGLAQQLGEQGLPKENVLDSLRAYNDAVDPVRHLYPPRRADHQPLATPPFVAVECVAGITYTMGGLAVDDELRVRHRDGSPIAGLFAAGADAGGVFHDVYAGGLAWAGVSGLSAGRGAARCVRVRA